MMAQEKEKIESGHVCPHKFAFILDNGLRRLVQNPVKILKEYINPGDTAVDLGCGPGFFTIDMAQLAGETGQVVAVDLQPRMLELVRKKSLKKGISERISLHQSKADSIGLEMKADFILAYYMVHETPDAARFFAEIKEMMTAKSRLLVVEPRFHVTKNAFDDMLKVAETTGLKATAFPAKKGGRSVVFMLP